MFIFPKIRVYGTLGFIVAMWTISLLKLEMSFYQLYIGAIASIVLVFLIFFISTQSCKIERKEEKPSFSCQNIIFLFKKGRVAVFLFFAMLLGSVFSEYPTIFLSISQFSEIIFILLLPLLLKKFKIEAILFMSMIAWILRLGLFAYGDFTVIGTIALFLSMVVYGCAFDFFNIAGALFLEKEIAPEFRSTAQGVFTTLVNGFGTFLGAVLCGWVIELNTVNGVVNWKTFWMIFTGYTASFTLLYVIYLFYPKNSQPKTAIQ
ncbi:MFS transporter [Providencia hangzhouensis]|uniref:MFS transporter n=1 Tax=Providencia hangzhouensis TaxID=3031799 RepID=UPI0034DD12B6